MKDIDREIKVGTIKFFSEKLGWGFIKMENSDEEFFVHGSGLVHQIAVDDRVTFQVMEGRKGLNAYNVQLCAEGNEKKPETYLPRMHGDYDHSPEEE